MLSTCTSMPSDTAVGVWRKSADRHLWLRVSLIHGLNTEAVRLGAHSRFVIFLSRDTEVWELHLYLPVAELIRSFPPPFFLHHCEHWLFGKQLLAQEHLCIEFSFGSPFVLVKKIYQFCCLNAQSSVEHHVSRGFGEKCSREPFIMQSEKNTLA